nr:transposase [Actinomycetota bacterium]
MPRPHPPEFRQRAVQLARLHEKPVSRIAEDLGISDSCLRGWMKQADVDEGRREGLSAADRDELVEL